MTWIIVADDVTPTFLTSEGMERAIDECTRTFSIVELTKYIIWCEIETAIEVRSNITHETLLAERAEVTEGPAHFILIMVIFAEKGVSYFTRPVRKDWTTMVQPHWNNVQSQMTENIEWQIGMHQNRNSVLNGIGIVETCIDSIEWLTWIGMLPFLSVYLTSLVHW